MTDLFEAEVATTTTLDMRRLQRQQRRATRRKWTLVLSAVGLVIVAIGGSAALSFVKETFAADENVIADYDSVGTGTVTVIIEAGQSGADIAKTLYDSGVVASEQAFINVASAPGSGANQIKPGHYFMARQMKAEYALTFLLDDDRRDVRKITIPEGNRIEFYFQKISDLTGATLDDVEKAAADHDAIGLPAEAQGSLEGWLFPATYQFNPGVTPTDVLRAMVTKTQQVLQGEGIPQDQWLRVLTVASLVEREAGWDVDRPLIAGVIQNRLDTGHALELDATIKYYAPSEGPFVSPEDKLIDNPYNTYMYPGLPPGPIAAPGLKSIQAAWMPAEHNYMFYVTIDLVSMETRYAETFQEHQKNVALLREWYATHGG